MSDLPTCGNCKRPLPHMYPTCLKNLMDDVDDLRKKDDLLTSVYVALQEAPFIPKETFIGKDDLAAKVMWLVRHAKLLYQNNQGVGRHAALTQQLDELKRQLRLVGHERDYLHGESKLLEEQRNKARATVRALTFAAQCSTRLVGDVFWWGGQPVGQVCVVPDPGNKPRKFYWVTYDVLLPEGAYLKGGQLPAKVMDSREEAIAELIDRVATVVMEHAERERKIEE